MELLVHRRRVLGARRLRRPMRLARVLLVVLLGLEGSAAAHPLDVGYLRIQSAAETVTIVLDLDRTAAALLIGAPESEMDAATAAVRASDLANATYRMAPIVTDRGPCTWTTARAELKDRTASMTEQAECPRNAKSLRWELPFIAGLPPTFQLMVKTSGFASDRLAIVDAAAPVLELGPVKESGFSEIVWSGVAHIGAAPKEWHDDGGFKLPEGIDHILFLLALLLGGGTLLQLVAIATGFTIGHSLTLALAALDIIRPTPSLIEPLVGLTIAAAALEALSGKLKRHRWKIAAAFGMIHGFAFASALRDLELSGGRMLDALLGFNLGVELGQLVFVLLFAAPIVWLHRKPEAAKLVVRGASSAIFIAGMYWFIERTVG